MALELIYVLVSPRLFHGVLVSVASRRLCTAHATYSPHPLVYHLCLVFTPPLSVGVPCVCGILYVRHQLAVLAVNAVKDFVRRQFKAQQTAEDVHPIRVDT